MRAIADFIFLILFIVLVIGWGLAWAAFHIAGGGIHLLLVLAVIFLVVHLFRGRSAV
jgi:formate hydrogenlyase subunit 4